MLIYSHRGFHLSLPENTLAAFAAAAALGVDGIETDVQVDARGEAVLYHDRLAPDGRLVIELTRAELSAAAGRDVPTLEEALAAIDVPAWDLEIKHPAATGAAIEVVRRHAGRRRILVTSFWHAAVDAVCAATGVEGGLLVAHRPRRIDPADVHPERPGVRTIVWNMNRLDAETVALARHAGLASWVYALETPGDHERCRRWGCDCIITDRPDWG